VPDGLDNARITIRRFDNWSDPLKTAKIKAPRQPGEFSPIG
jgi:hypothetical protein